MLLERKNFSHFLEVRVNLQKFEGMNFLQEKRRGWRNVALQKSNKSIRTFEDGQNEGKIYLGPQKQTGHLPVDASDGDRDQIKLIEI